MNATTSLHATTLRRLAWLIGAGLLMGCLLRVQAQAAEPLKLVTGDYAPFTGAHLPQGGPLTEVARRAFAESGIAVKVHFLPWKRGYAETQAGQYDGSFPYGRSLERENAFYFSESAYTIDRRMYFLADTTAKPRDPRWLKDKRYCVPLGFTMLKELGPLIERKELEVHSTPNLESCVKMLALRRVDFFITTPDIADAALALASPNTPLASQSVGKSENFLIVPKTHPQGPAIIAAFNKGLAALKAKGELEKIMRGAGR